MHDHDDHPETFNVHGMLLFGEDPLYFSHLPMFRHPAHRFQALMEVDFRGDVREAVRSDLKAAAGGIHTFVPEPFDILELDPAGGGPARTSVKGTVVRGHFERGGVPIAEDVTARIVRVIHFERLDPALRHDERRTLTYLCFGRPGGLHLAHEITARPDFDQVLAVRMVPPGEGFERPVPVTFDRPDASRRRLVAGDTADGVFDLGVSRTGEHRFTARVEVVREIYMETGDLD